MVNPDDDPRFKQYWQAYHRIMGRRGVSPEAAKAAVHRSTTTIASLMVHLGDADGMLCGLQGRYDAHLEHIRDVIGIREGESAMAALSGLTIDKRTLFIADTYVNEMPTSEQLARIARQSGARGAPFRPDAESGLRLALELRFLAAVNRPSACAMPTTCSRSRTRMWNAMARCTAMRRSPKSCAGAC